MGPLWVQSFFLLCQVFTDDEALTKLLHFGRSLARFIAFRISHPLSSMSSSMLSIHFFFGRPLLLTPSTSPCSAFAGILPFSILITCPYHVSLLLFILPTIVSFCPSSSRVTSFRIFSLRDLFSNPRSHPISATSSLRSSSFFTHQVSAPYKRTGITSVSYNLIFVLIEMLPDLHSFLSFPNIADAIPVLFLMSLVDSASSVITPPRYTNSFTCSNASPSNMMVIFSFSLPIVIVFVFSPLILSPNLLLLSWTLVVSSCSCSSLSAIRSISSANLKLLTISPLILTPISVSAIAMSIIASSIRLNR